MFQLRPDQMEDLVALMVNERHGLWSDPGTGKTPIVCVYQKWLWTDHNTRSVWVMPLSLMEKNKEEAIKFGGWNDEDVLIVKSPKDLDKVAVIYIVTFSMFRAHWSKLHHEVRAIQVDEIHKGFSNHESNQTLALYEFCSERKARFVPMTGTILSGKLDTAYPSIRLIQPIYYGNYDQFKNTHHIIDILTGKRIGYRGHDLLKEILQLHGQRRLFSDIFGKQEVVIQKEELHMVPEQKAIYEKFEKEAILELEQFFIDGSLPGVSFTRSRQIMEHPNLFPDLRYPNERKFVDLIPGKRPAKLDRLDIHITDHIERDEPLVIFASLIPQQYQIFELATKLGANAAFINGDVKLRDRNAIDNSFKAGTTKVLICSPAVADVGFNWQFSGDKEVSHCIFASLDYLDTAFIQGCRRFVRGKRTNPLRITVMKYVNSVDSHIARLVSRKSAEAAKVDPTLEILDL